MMETKLETKTVKATLKEKKAIIEAKKSGNVNSKELEEINSILSS